MLLRRQESNKIIQQEIIYILLSILKRKVSDSKPGESMNFVKVSLTLMMALIITIPFVWSADADYSIVEVEYSDGSIEMVESSGVA